MQISLQKQPNECRRYTICPISEVRQDSSDNANDLWRKRRKNDVFSLKTSVFKWERIRKTENMKLTTKPGYLNATYCSNFLYWEKETLNVRLFKWNPQEMERSSLIVFVKIRFFLLSYCLGLFFRSTKSYDKCVSFFCLFVVVSETVPTQHNDQTIFFIPPSFLHKRFARKGWVHKKN